MGMKTPIVLKVNVERDDYWLEDAEGKMVAAGCSHQEDYLERLADCANALDNVENPSAVKKLIEVVEENLSGDWRAVDDKRELLNALTELKKKGGKEEENECKL